MRMRERERDRENENEREGAINTEDKNIREKEIDKKKNVLCDQTR